MNPVLNFCKISFIILLMIVSASCHKEGTGGKSSVSGGVYHHSKLIPYSRVFIKYGATDFPGTDTTTYDDHVTSDVNAHYQFKDLRIGNYFLYGVGYDLAGPYIVTGGVGIKLSYNKSSTTDVPVTE
jgi:hypothetical protein